MLVDACLEQGIVQGRSNGVIGVCTRVDSIADSKMSRSAKVPSGIDPLTIG